MVLNGTISRSINTFGLGDRLAYSIIDDSDNVRYAFALVASWQTLSCLALCAVRVVRFDWTDIQYQRHLWGFVRQVDCILDFGRCTLPLLRQNIPNLLYSWTQLAFSDIIK